MMSKLPKCGDTVRRLVKQLPIVTSQVEKAEKMGIKCRYCRSSPSSVQSRSSYIPPSLALPFPRVLLIQTMAIIDLAFDDMPVLEHFLVHVSEELLLSLEKMLEMPNIHRPSVAFIVP